MLKVLLDQVKLSVVGDMLSSIIIYECQQTRTLEEAELSRNRILLKAGNEEQLKRTLLDDFPEYGYK